MNLPKKIFWDTDMNVIDFKAHARFVIQRVIQKGALKDWTTIKKYYGLDFIKQEILLMRNLDTKTLNFFSVYFGLPKTQFRCYTIQQSTPQLYK